VLTALQICLSFLILFSWHFPFCPGSVVFTFIGLSFLGQTTVRITLVVEELWFPGVGL